MFRSRLHRFLLASVVVLGIISFFMGRYVVSWRPVQLTEQESKTLITPPDQKDEQAWFSPDHRWTAKLVGSDQREVLDLRVLNLDTRRSFIVPIQAYAPQSTLDSIAISPHFLAASVLSCGEDSCSNYAWLYNTGSKGLIHVQLLSIQKAEHVEQIQFSRDETRLFVATTRSLYSYDVRTGCLIKKFKIGHPSQPASNSYYNCAALTPDARFYLQFHSFVMSLWDTQQEKLIHLFPTLPSVKGAVQVEPLPTYSPDARTLHYLTSTNSGHMTRHFIDTFSGRQMWSTSLENSNAEFFSSNGQEYFICSDNGVEVWNLHTGHLIRSLPKMYAHHRWLSPDENTLYSLVFNGEKTVVWKQRAR